MAGDETDELVTLHSPVSRRDTRGSNAADMSMSRRMSSCKYRQRSCTVNLMVSTVS